MRTPIPIYRSSGLYTGHIQCSKLPCPAATHPAGGAGRWLVVWPAAWLLVSKADEVTMDAALQIMSHHLLHLALGVQLATVPGWKQSADKITKSEHHGKAVHRGRIVSD